MIERRPTNRRYKRDVPELDLLIVAGTSLTVSPANSLVGGVGPQCVRLLVNRDRVGEDLGLRFGPDSQRDVFAAGDCDEVFCRLAQLLGWTEGLQQVAPELPEKSRETLAKYT
mmetsp:Transcript_74428/g.174671  ORF Transcript_74428/g.174671 Transcript_74428/m.174671 type:complete len:113 (-) Transcript_74428:23-361(-)